MLKESAQGHNKDSVIPYVLFRAHCILAAVLEMSVSLFLPLTPSNDPLALG